MSDAKKPTVNLELLRNLLIYFFSFPLVSTIKTRELTWFINEVSGWVAKSSAVSQKPSELIANKQQELKMLIMDDEAQIRINTKLEFYKFLLDQSSSIINQIIRDLRQEVSELEAKLQTFSLDLAYLINKASSYSLIYDVDSLGKLLMSVTQPLLPDKFLDVYVYKLAIICCQLINHEMIRVGDGIDRRLLPLGYLMVALELAGIQNFFSPSDFVLNKSSLEEGEFTQVQALMMAAGDLKNQFLSRQDELEQMQKKSLDNTSEWSKLTLAVELLKKRNDPIVTANLKKNFISAELKIAKKDDIKSESKSNSIGIPILNCNIGDSGSSGSSLVPPSPSSASGTVVVSASASLFDANGSSSSVIPSLEEKRKKQQESALRTLQKVLLAEPLRKQIEEYKKQGDREACIVAVFEYLWHNKTPLVLSGLLQIHLDSTITKPNVQKQMYTILDDVLAKEPFNWVKNSQSQKIVESPSLT